MKKPYRVVNSKQFHLTFTQQRPKSCVERVHTKANSRSAGKENHDGNLCVICLNQVLDQFYRKEYS